MKKIACIILTAILSAFCLTACNDGNSSKDNKVGLEIYVINDSGEYEYIDSKSGDYVLNRLYALDMHEDYLLYIGTYSDGKFGGVAYDNISFSFDRRKINITRCDGCEGSYFVLSGVNDCIGSEIEINVRGTSPYKFDYIYKMKVSFHYN